MAKASTEFTYRKSGPTGPKFKQSEFEFVERPHIPPNPLTVLTVDGAAGINALRFSKDGMDVTLPLLSNVVRLRIWTGAGPVKIEAFDEGGGVIWSKVDGGDKAFVDAEIRADGIAAIRLMEGGGEASLETISIEGN